MRIGILIVVIGVVLSACAEQPTIYGAHSYRCCAELAGTTWWHAGQTLRLHWQATPPHLTADATPHPIVLSLSLTGPFANVDTLKQAISQGSKPAGVRTITAARISANDRMVEAPASQLDLPADLPPGFYNVATTAAEAGHSVDGSAILKVTAPDQP